jgi:hypothetical protein
VCVCVCVRARARMFPGWLSCQGQLPLKEVQKGVDTVSTF